MSKSLIQGVLDLDPWLEPFSQPLINRQIEFQKWHKKLIESEGSLIDFANSYKKYGVHTFPSGEIQIIQYIPDVDEVSIVG